MSEPIAGKFDRRPISGHATQFDGTIPSLLAIFNLISGNTDGVFMSILFGPNGTVREANFSGYLTLTIRNRDWVIIPDDGTSLFTVTNDEYLAAWTSDSAAPAQSRRGKRS